MMDTCLEIEQGLALASGCLVRCWVLEILAIGLVADDSMSSCLEIEQISLMGLVGWQWQKKVRVWPVWSSRPMHRRGSRR